MIVAAGVDAITVGADVAFNDAGAAPKLHVIMAPVTTNSGMMYSPFLLALLCENPTDYA